MVLNGIDISSWQGNIDVSKVPCDFVIVKATEGTSYVNPYCDTRYQLAKKAGKLLGVYHYAKNGNPEAEADFFYKNSKGYVGEAVLFLDYEEGLSVSSPTWCRRFLDRLKVLTGGVKGLLYTYQSMLNSQNWQTVKDGDYGLWYASYGADNPITGYKRPSAPAVNYWGNPTIYQYSSKTRLANYNGALDANSFYGDRTAWLAYAKAQSSTGGSARKLDDRSFGSGTYCRLRKTATNWYGGQKISSDEKGKVVVVTSKEIVNRYGSKYVYSTTYGKKILVQDIDYLCCPGWDVLGSN
ncbi:hypothetical protein IGI37_003125 [Enterococcus sp. AZ194]|uniref:GH25 family lysozyme n=1 Tax=Enterococcus sp. AZ194 TaxID=2774629 RepID=UPI003F254123